MEPNKLSTFNLSDEILYKLGKTDELSKTIEQQESKILNQELRLE